MQDHIACRCIANPRQCALWHQHAPLSRPVPDGGAPAVWGCAAPCPMDVTRRNRQSGRNASERVTFWGSFRPEVLARSWFRRSKIALPTHAYRKCVKAPISTGMGEKASLLACAGSRSPVHLGSCPFAIMSESQSRTPWHLLHVGSSGTAGSEGPVGVREATAAGSTSRLHDARR